MRDASLLSGELKLAARLDARFFALLEAIDATRSLRKAASTAGYSYKGAWLLLEMAAGLACQPLIETATGGAHGGGSQLTPAASALLQAWHALQLRHEAFLTEQETWLLQQPAFARLLRRSSMKTTARNQFVGTIRDVEIGPVSAQATVALSAGLDITATLTANAARRLQLQRGQDAIAIVKAASVVLVTDFDGYMLSARNQLAGTISRIDAGPVSALVGLTLPGGAAVTASVTNDAVASLALTVGTPATAVFKAYSVMLAVAGA